MKHKLRLCRRTLRHGVTTAAAVKMQAEHQFHLDSASLEASIHRALKERAGFLLPLG